MKPQRKSNQIITIDDNSGITEILQARLSCSTREDAVRKLLGCLDRLHNSEEKTRFERIFEKVINKTGTDQ
jgi:hypothetical protein